MEQYLADQSLFFKKKKRRKSMSPLWNVLLLWSYNLKGKYQLIYSCIIFGRNRSIDRCVQTCKHEQLRLGDYHQEYLAMLSVLKRLITRKLNRLLHQQLINSEHCDSTTSAYDLFVDLSFAFTMFILGHLNYKNLK